MSINPRPRRFRPRTDAGRAHADWLLLVDASGPFFSVPVLSAVFSTGVERLPADLRIEASLRWDGTDEESGAIVADDRGEWVRWVLEDLLDFGDHVIDGRGFQADGPEPGTKIVASLAVVSDPDSPSPGARLLVSVLPPGTGPDGRPGDGWPATWAQRMALLCRRTGCRLGLVTDGDLLRFVWAPKNTSTGQATWRSSLFSSERAHLDSLWTVFHAHRFFSVGTDQQPEALLERSEAAEEEVTDTLGTQVRHAVELLVAALDRANRDSGGAVLAGIEPSELYEAAATVMMRLVFLLSAEEQGLLPINNKLYNDGYAISTLRAQLEEAEHRGRERLEGVTAAWHRILAVSRAVFGGVTHESLSIVPNNGPLFDPDRFPFLEGRRKGTDSWWQGGGIPPQVDDLTVLEVMRSLQVLRLSAQDTRHLSFRNIEVEQIGHVYERLLDHSAVLAETTVLGLVGRPGQESEVRLADIEAAGLSGSARLVQYLAEVTGVSAAAITRGLDSEADQQRLLALRAVCGGDASLTRRVTPYLGLLREDLRGFPLVFPTDSYYVTKTGDRRSTGATYTTRAFAEQIAGHALEPLCYQPGPAETDDGSQWRIRSSEEILNLKVCDPAVGSGAILVAACRYLANRLIDAWVAEGEIRPMDLASTSDEPHRLDHRVRAVRLVAERCCYGVDQNPMAVELARMSFWLETMAFDRPFTFLEHNLRVGDSLVGLTSLNQLRVLHTNPNVPLQHLLPMGIDAEGSWTMIGPMIDDAIALRRTIEQTPSDTSRDIAAKEVLSAKSTEAVKAASAIADLVVGCAFANANNTNPDAAVTKCLSENSGPIRVLLDCLGKPSQDNAIAGLAARAQALINAAAAKEARSDRTLLHWPLVFPEVFTHGREGFDAIVGNPPFVTGKRISTYLSPTYQAYLKNTFIDSKGAADLCVYFLRRAFSLCRKGGYVGMIATKSIAEGDSRLVGPLWLANHGASFRWVDHELPWPGEASVTVSLIALRKGTWDSQSILNGKSVGHISSRFTDDRESDVYPLTENKGMCSDGIKIQGDGFIISEGERLSLFTCDSENAEVIRPYLTGMDIAQRVGSRPSAWIISFGTMSFEEATLYKAPFDLLVNRVRPYRESLTGQIHESAFWRFWDKREAFFQRVAGQAQILACPSTAKYLLMTLVNEDCVASHSVKLFAAEPFAGLAVMQSSVHEVWARAKSGKLEQRLAYNLSNAFATFPWPEEYTRLEALGKEFVTLRNETLMSREICLTDLYNLVHNSACVDRDVRLLRNSHERLDHEVMQAYGWGDMSLDHEFYNVTYLPSSDNRRYTISDAARI